MKKQTLILTGWLSMPFVCLTILMVWIFTSLDKERLMDEPPVGAGAGDTGNANALGQYLAGRDPDAISDATGARRDQRAIDPLVWPGGVTIRVQQSAIAPTGDSGVMIYADSDSEHMGFTTSMILDRDGYFVVTIHEVRGIDLAFYIGRGVSKTTTKPMEITDANGRRLRPIILAPMIPDPGLQVSDPIVVTLDVDSVYIDSLP